MVNAGDHNNRTTEFPVRAGRYAIAGVGKDPGFFAGLRTIKIRCSDSKPEPAALARRCPRSFLSASVAARFGQDDKKTVGKVRGSRHLQGFVIFTTWPVGLILTFPALGSNRRRAVVRIGVISQVMACLLAG
jgi:hypothetical protein